MVIGWRSGWTHSLNWSTTCSCDKVEPSARFTPKLNSAFCTMERYLMSVPVPASLHNPAHGLSCDGTLTVSNKAVIVTKLDWTSAFSICEAMV